MTTINDTNVAVQSEVMENDYALVLPGNWILEISLTINQSSAIEKFLAIPVIIINGKIIKKDRLWRIAILTWFWSARLNFGRSRNTASSDLKTILVLVKKFSKVMVKRLKIIEALVNFNLLHFWKFISWLPCSVVNPKRFRCLGYSVYVMRENSWSLVRSILFVLDQKISYLVSTPIHNKILG